jgi:glycyl-tRNA synthetase beta chain
MPEATAEFLLEIGCEEIPAGWFAPPIDLRENLRQRFVGLVEEARLWSPGPAGAKLPTPFSTPRRLGLSAQLLRRQEDRGSIVWGPAVKAARDSSDRWTKAALGFASKMGAEPDGLRQGVKDPAKPDDLYLFVERREAGKAAVEVLPGVIAALLRRLVVPKRMSWDAWIEDGKGAFPFGRPIRWMVALLDGEVVPFSIHQMVDGGPGPVAVQSGNRTFGHRFLPRGAVGQAIPVKSYADLEARLGEAAVVLAVADRARRIGEGLESAARGAAFDDHGLAVEWADLVEYPTVVAGDVPPEFRRLPTEVLETVLVHHQKYVPLIDGGTVTRFAAVIDSDDTSAAAIVRGMERVVVARLRDAAFFWAEDMKRPLEDRISDLAGVTFHQGLGSYKDKAERMARFVDAMGAEMGLLTKPEHEAARRAALLSKADLTTAMVREFPELQGVMGGIYLQAQGEPWANVAAAVRWHYHPIALEPGSVPAAAFSGGDGTVFAALSVADKLDTLAGYFGLGLVPTGSSDPFGLRRAAQGALRAILDFWKVDVAERQPSLRSLAAAAVSGYGANLKRPTADVRRDLEAFLLDRLRYLLSARGFPGDEIEAALGAREPEALDDPTECVARLAALHSVRSEAREDFEGLAAAFKRAHNILGDAAPIAVEPALFSEPAERELFDAVSGLGSANGRIDARLRSLARLRTPVDHFFDNVLVMAEDPRVRANRLALLHQTLSLFFRIADISKLGGQA